jgi:integrase
VRTEHLSLLGAPAAEGSRRRRAAPGEGSLEQVGPATWKFTVARGTYDDGSLRRVYRTIKADTEPEARRLAAGIVAEVDQEQLPSKRDDRDLTVDEAVRRYINEYLRDEKGRERRTVKGYRQLHRQWFSPDIGQRRMRDVDEAAFDRVFGKMRRSGLSSSRMKEGLKLYKPLFRWAKRRGIVRRNPLADFDLPKSSYVPKRRVPPEVDQLCRLLAAAVEHVPDIAPILTLAAVTGMRRGELVAVRRTSIRWSKGVLYVDEAADIQGTKHTKTDTRREVTLDDDTLEMLQRTEERMLDRAVTFGVDLADDGFLFSLEPDGSECLPPEHLTRELAKVKEALGIADKRPETVAREDEALRLYREGDSGARAPGRTGPRPKGALSFAEIGRRLDRSEKWAWSAVRAAERREAVAAELGDVEWFDGSLLGVRKFTTSELLDEGFDISNVAERQGHSPIVARKHYSKNRRSTDRRATEHLARLVHHQPPTPPDSSLGL